MTLIADQRSLRINLGLCSRTGRRADNQDFVAGCVGTSHELALRGQLIALADGVGGTRGGRVAAELAVGSFIEGYYDQAATLGIPQAAARSIGAINSWIHAQGRDDQALRHAATTLTALVLQGRSAHVLHVGDSRAYHLHEEQLTRLTQDHCLTQPDLSHVLYRAVGIEATVRLDHRIQPLRALDRLMICSDGVHGVLGDHRLRELLLRRNSSAQDAAQIVAAAFDAGSQDNLSVALIDVLSVPEAAAPELLSHIAALPMRTPPVEGDIVDGFQIGMQLSDGRYSRLLRALDTHNGQQVVLKFPQPVANASTHHLAFLREAWVAARLHSPFIGATIELPGERQTCLYSVMPYYEGETLEQRLRRAPRLSLSEGCELALKLARATASLHRAGIIHRDIKPDNVLLERNGGLKLIDLGVVRLPQLEDFPGSDIPGTPSFMAPELFDGANGDELSDQYALGVTLYRAFSREYPYGEIEPFTRPRFTRPTPLTRHRPDLPAWLDHLLTRAVDPQRAARFSDTLELALELESGMARGEQHRPRALSLYDRNPLRFWQITALLLGMALLLSLALR
ncbi:MAG: protein kinase [Steroidobacteraceae bacterium]